MQRLFKGVRSGAVFCGIAGFQILAAAQGVVPPAVPPSTQPPVSITVDLDQSVGAFKPIYSWFGYDEANYTTMTHGRELLRQLHATTAVPVYIRVHNLLTSGDGKTSLKVSSTNVYSEDAAGRPSYNFTILDGIFDEFQAAGVRPMVELGFMPKDLAATIPGRDVYQVYFPKDTLSGSSNNPPKDYVKWGNLVRAVTQHLVERYGRDTVRQWYFEVWNEPNIGYWHGTEQAYNKLYDYAAAGVQSALPGALVGGPATTSPSGPQAYQFLKDFLDHVTTGRSAATGGRVPFDFISFHAKGRPSIENGVVTMGLRYELEDADHGFSLVSQYPQLRRLPVILSEADPEGCAACSSERDPANNYRNGTLYPAYTAAALHSLFALQDKYGVNLLAMLSWSFEFEGFHYFQGFRSLATNGIDKPELNVFRMFGMMAGTRVETTSTGSVPLDTLLSTGVRGAPDVDGMATTEAKQAAVLMWNYHDANVVAAPSPVSLQVHGLPTGVTRVLVQYYRIDATHSNAYTLWQSMGSPQTPTAAQYAQLKAGDGLQLLESPQWLDVTNGVLTMSTSMPRQSISLVRLSW